MFRGIEKPVKYISQPVTTHNEICCSSWNFVGSFLLAQHRRKKRTCSFIFISNVLAGNTILRYLDLFMFRLYLRLNCWVYTFISCARHLSLWNTSAIWVLCRHFYVIARSIYHRQCTRLCIFFHLRMYTVFFVVVDFGTLHRTRCHCCSIISCIQLLPSENQTIFFASFNHSLLG